MKKSLMGLIVISLVLFAGTAGATTLWLNPSAQSVGGSTAVSVEVLISGVNAPGVDTLNFVLGFDTSLLDATGIHAADVSFMGITVDMFVDLSIFPGTESFTQFGPELDNVNGQVSFTLWNVGSLGATGSGTVAVLTFVTDASNTGTAHLDYTSWLLEPATAKDVTHSAHEADITVTEGPVIPEPATLLLVAAGLAALGGYAKRKRT
jgi:hypothetical protein